MQKINLKTARQFIISNQLDFEKKSTHQIIQQLGYIQIDTISVIQRTHHHVLWTRNNNYQVEELPQLLKEKKIFDYWAHAASFLPMEDYRFSLVRKSQMGAGNKFWYDRNPKNMKYILDRIKAEGALMSRDFKKEKIRKEGVPWIKSPINQAMMQLFMEGKIMITEREGLLKKFDLPERVLPNNVNTKMPSEEEYFKYLITRELRAQGIMKAREFGYLLKIDRKRLKVLLGEMVKEGELEEVIIKKGIGESYFALPKSLSAFLNKKIKKELYVLSPFDNLIIQRQRLKELFDFEYLLECYVPAAKRKVGYFSLPILYGTEFVGQIDLKADRKKKTLLVKNLVWEKGVKKSETFFKILNKKINALMHFNNCQQIEDAGFLPKPKL